MDLGLGDWVWGILVLLASCVTLGKVTAPHPVPAQRRLSICWLLNEQAL